MLLVSILMIWDVRNPSAFLAFFSRPIRDSLELTFLVAALGSAVLVGWALFKLIRARGPICALILRALAAVAWCLLLVMCLILMGVQTGIV
jgi:hypothetical protein